MNKNEEIEIKFLFTEEKVKDLKNKIKELGIERKTEKYEKTIMFDSNGRMEEIDAWLRIREVRDDKTDLIEFSFKHFKQRLHNDGDLGDGVEKQKEVQIEIDGSQKEGFLEILNLMGYTKTKSYERFREKYIIDEVELVIDKFPFGYIVDLEAESKEKITTVLAKLGLDSRKSTKMSCGDVYNDLCKKNGLEIKPDIEFDDPDMPKLEI